MNKLAKLHALANNTNARDVPLDLDGNENENEVALEAAAPEWNEKVEERVKAQNLYEGSSDSDSEEGAGGYRHTNPKPKPNPKKTNNGMSCLPSSLFERKCKQILMMDSAYSQGRGGVCTFWYVQVSFMGRIGEGEVNEE